MTASIPVFTHLMMISTGTAANLIVHSFERLGRGQVKGSVVRAHVDWVRECASREETIEFFESLSPEIRRDATNTLASSWYPFATLVEIDRAIAASFGGGRTSFLQELGRFSARRNLSAVETMLAGADPHVFFQRTALLHPQFQDFGNVQYMPIGEKLGAMLHTNHESFSPVWCASAAGFYEEALRMHGCADASVSEMRCQCLGDSECRFELVWS